MNGIPQGRDGMTATLEAREVTYTNLDQLLRLNVRADQEHLVAPNSVTIAEANYMPNSWLRGLWLLDEPIGLMAMINIDANHPEIDEHIPGKVAYLWRLMIDAQHQGYGHGRNAIAIAFDQARKWRRPTLYLSVSRDKGNAMPFYRRFGFKQAGGATDGELLLKQRVV